MDASPHQPRYLQRVRYALNQTIVFPDFTLRYTGSTVVKARVYPQGFTFDNFVVDAGGKRQVVRWSAGTGDIGPAVIKVGGKTFWLELAISDQLGMLGPGVLVVSPAPETRSSPTM